MKYIKEAAIKSKAAYTIIINVLISIVYLAMNTKVLSWISEAVSSYQNHEVAWRYINFVIAGCVFNLVISIVRPWFTNIGKHRIYTYLNNKFADKVLSADCELFTKFSPGEIISTSGTLWDISTLLQVVIAIIRNGASFLITLIAIWMIDYRVAIPVVGIYVVGFCVLNAAVKRWNKLDNERDNLKRKRNRELDEVINGFAEVRSFSHAANKHQESIHELNNSILSGISKRTRVDSVITVLYQTIDGVITIGILLYAVMALQQGIFTSSATAVTLTVYAWRLMEPMGSFVDGINELSVYKAPLPKFEKIMDYENTIPVGHIELESFDNEIQFNAVGFSYDKSSSVLSDINLTIKKGEHIGVCGPTGGGKSTLLKLIPKFYAVTSGSLTIDGINLNDIEVNSLREHIGIVHQDPYIFDDTLMNNIKYAGLGKTTTPDSVSDTEVIDACKRAQIYDFIMSLPDGFQTQVGPRGLKLSGGQKQRIALARLFISNPDIILLDEATAALDNETERFVQDSLNAFHDKTMIVVAHRLSTIKDSDKIIVVNNHNIVQCGTHDELLKEDGIYAKMYRASLK
jgi:ABC-type multidrug transport system fused ATPase/permease subunit